jgi:type VII secretion protein EccE
MTQAPARPQTVPGTGRPRSTRAGLRPAGPGPAGSGDVGVTPRPRPAHLGVVHVIQLVIVEGAALGVLIAARGDVAAVVLAALAGLLVVGVTLTRRRGRWLAEWMLLDARARRRRRFVPDPAGTDPRLAALRCLAPRLSVQDVEGSEGSAVGVGYDGEGWFAAAAIAATTGLTGDGSPSVPLGALAAVLDPHPQAGLDDPGQSRTAVQVVTLTTPAPDAALDDASPAGRSYRELLAATGSAPADRITWVSVRLEARMLAEVGAGDQDEAVRVPPALLRMVRRLVKTLRSAGLPVQVLDADGLVDALARCCDLLPPADVVPGTRADAPVTTAPAGSSGTSPGQPARGPVAPEESRRLWRSASLEHVTFWLRDWPQPTARPTLLDDLAAVPAGLTSVAVRLVAEHDDLRDTGTGTVPGRREPSADDRFDVRALVRVAAPADRLDGACEAMSRAAEDAGARLFRLDGEQAPAAYATAPTGGGPR